VSVVLSMGRSVVAALAFLALGQTICPANAAEQVGNAKHVVNTVTDAGPVGRRNLAAEDPVYRNDAISAAAASHGELLLHDGSHVIVGENSTVSLDNFVISGSSFSAGTVKVTKGAFRFISGNSGKEAISIRTPLASIGVRGTVVDVYVEPHTGVTRTILISGRITACSSPGRCLTVHRSCDIIEVGRNGQVRQLPFLHSSRWSQADEARLFGLTVNQQNFSSQWRAFEGGCYARAAEEIRSDRSKRNEPSPPPDVVPPPVVVTPTPPPGDCEICL